TSQWTAWTAFFDLAPGEAQTLTFEYELPIWVLDYEPGGEMRYHLRAQKQPGTGAVPLRVTVILPVGAEPVLANPADTLSAQGNALSATTDLQHDREFEIVFRQGR
ncbi:MAG: hypothetical protein ACK2U9_13530, partial [Anaerolineae bacterium]